MLRSTFVGFSLALALTLGAAKSAEAAPFFITIEQQGFGGQILVDDNGANDQFPWNTVTNEIDYDGDSPSGLVGLKIHATTNAPGIGTARLTQSTIAFENLSTTTVVLTITTTSLGFDTPGTAGLDISNSLLATSLTYGSTATVTSYVWDTQVSGSTGSADTGPATVNGWNPPGFGHTKLDESEYIGFVRGDGNFNLSNVLTLTLVAGGEANLNITTEAKGNANLNQDVIPEPASLVIWGLGLGVAGIARFRRRRR